MALTLSLNFTAETKTGSTYTGTLTDATSYGGTEPLRTGGALFIYGKKVKKDGSQDSLLSIQNYDPETATSFTFTIPKDGWHQFYLVFIRNYTAGTYAQYQCVYDPVANIVYRSTVASNNAAPPTNWAPVSTPALLVDNVGTPTESPNLEYLVYNRIIFPNAKQFYGTASAAAALSCCNECERSEDILVYEKAAVNVDALVNFDVRGQHASGEELSRNSDEFIAEHS